MPSERYVTLDVFLVRKETEKAFLVVLDNEESLWIPKSVILEPERFSEGDDDCGFDVAEWWCRKEGIEVS